jgi:hypothetical protein
MKPTNRRRSRPSPIAALAERISQTIDGELDGESARDVTASFAKVRAWRTFKAARTCCPPLCCAIRRRIRWPTANSCSPFASVVPVSQDAIPRALGPSLVVTAITHDRKLIARLLASPDVGRLNLGAIPTQRISWDQPHEGNLFDHLYARRAFQKQGGLQPARALALAGKP